MSAANTILVPLVLSLASLTAPTREVILTRSTTLDRNAVLKARLVIRASHIVVDGNGATLVGPARPGDRASYQNAGVGVQADGVSGVTLRNL